MNDVLIDMIGVVFLSAGFLFCAVHAHHIQRGIHKVLPCEAAILAKRMEALNGNLHTAIINSMCLFLLICLKIEWMLAKISTAPIQIDVQVLTMEIIIMLTLCRSSICSLRNAERLLILRTKDTETGCQYCPKKTGGDNACSAE